MRRKARFLSALARFLSSTPNRASVQAVRWLAWVRRVSTRLIRRLFRRIMPEVEDLMDSLPTVTSRSPQDPSDVVVEVGAVGPSEVECLTRRAGQAARLWRRCPAPQRADALAGAAEVVAASAEQLTALIVREVGKPVTEARAEVARGVAILRYFGQQALDPIGETYSPSDTGLLFTERVARGVAGLITPWNFPVAIPLWKAAPALAFGNGVVLKPAPHATATALFLGQLLARVLPPELLHVVPGEAATGRAVAAMADCVSFTGSAEVGRQVVSTVAARGVPVQAEMGGQNAAVVFPDADPDRTAAHIVHGAFGYAGQKCTATRRIIVVGEHPELVDALINAVRALPVGDPADASTVVGPVVSEAAQHAVRSARDAVARDGGRVLAETGEPPAAGWFVPPALVDQLPADHELCREELFGPMCVLLHARDDADAIQLANAVRYGLVTGVHGRDLDRVLSFASEVDTGMVKVNSSTAGVDFYLPFGGAKDSGYGPREQGKAARDFYTRERTVAVPFDYR